MQRRPEFSVPSTNGHGVQRPVLPRALDKLRWLRQLVGPADLQILDMVRDDLAQELAELLGGGTPERDAQRYIRRRVRLEYRHFAPCAVRWQAERVAHFTRRAPARMARPAAALVALGVTLSALWLLFDPSLKARALESTEQLARLEERAQRNAGRLDGESEVTPEALAAIARHENLQREADAIRQRYPDEFLLSGFIGTFDEDLARFWGAVGDDTKAKEHWALAVGAYVDGLAENDPVALLHFGEWLLDHQQWRDAAFYLRRSVHAWANKGVISDASAQAAANLHFALYQLWVTQHDLTAAAEAHEIERVTERAHRTGRDATLTCQVLFNAACLHTLMIQEGLLPATEGFSVLRLLGESLDSAGELAPVFARMILDDPDLDGLRDLEVFRSIQSRANSLLK